MRCSEVASSPNLRGHAVEILLNMAELRLLLRHIGRESYNLRLKDESVFLRPLDVPARKSGCAYGPDQSNQRKKLVKPVSAGCRSPHDRPFLRPIPAQGTRTR